MPSSLYQLHFLFYKLNRRVSDTSPTDTNGLLFFYFESVQHTYALISSSRLEYNSKTGTVLAMVEWYPIRASTGHRRYNKIVRF